MRVAAVAMSGEIAARAHAATPREQDAEATLDRIAELARACTEKVGSDRIAGLGAAVPATFRPDGTLAKLPNIPCLNGLDLRAVLSERLGIAVELVNDATAATLGEHWLGASKGFQNVVGVTLGTGLGGGLVINGEIFEGAGRNAGEIGHICVEPDGIPCGCGSNGCVEQYASGLALMRFAAEAKLNAATPKDVYDRAKSGIDSAVAIFNSFGRYLGVALSGLVNVISPDAIVIGGGVSASWDLFIDPLRAEVERRAFPEPAAHAKIIRASLGDDAGVLGAAKLTFKKLA